MRRSVLRSLITIPKDPKELFAWAMKRLLFMLFASLGGWWLVLGVFAASTFVVFMVGLFTGSGFATVNRVGHVTLSPQTQLTQNLLAKKAQSDALAVWQPGLSASEITQVQTQQVGLPGAVLLAVGKMENNLTPFHAAAYAAFLKPDFTWQSFPDRTVTHHWITRRQTTRVKRKGYWTTQTRTIRQCVAAAASTSVTLLSQARTWDGALANTYRIESVGPNVCPPPGQTSTWTQRAVLVTSRRTYSWRPLWSLFAAMPSTVGWLRANRINEQTLAGLLAAQNAALSDPYVQQMVPVIQTGGLLPSFGHFTPEAASGHVVPNVLRYRPVIDAYARAFSIPAPFVMAIMAQESGGNQYGPGGTVLSSGVGSGGAGALGLMQVEPATASGMYVGGRYIGAQAMVDLADPVTNLEIGIEYLAELYDEFGHSEAEAASAYNAGPGGEEEALLSGYTVAQNAQTEAYVGRVMGVWLPAFSAVTQKLRTE